MEVGKQSKSELHVSTRRFQLTLSGIQDDVVTTRNGVAKVYYDVIIASAYYDVIMAWGVTFSHVQPH